MAATDRGFMNVDIQMRTNVPHKTVHEVHVAAEVIAGERQGKKELAAATFNARVIPSVTCTVPEVALAIEMGGAVDIGKTIPRHPG